jgi:hypothetical protein
MNLFSQRLTVELFEKCQKLHKTVLKEKKKKENWLKGFKIEVDLSALREESENVQCQMGFTTHTSSLGRLHNVKYKIC